MSPFNDLGRRSGVAPRAEHARSLPSFGRTPAAGSPPAAHEEVQGMSPARFAQLLALGILGLAALLALGVRGVVLVQGYAAPAPRIGIQEPGPKQDVREATREAWSRVRHARIP